MKIHSKKVFKFEMQGQKPVIVRNMEFKTVPDWVRETKLFKLAREEGVVVEVVSKEQEISLDNDGYTQEEKLLREKARELGITKWKTYSLDTLKTKIAECEQKEGV